MPLSSPTSLDTWSPIRPAVRSTGRIVPLHRVPTIAHGGLARRQTSHAGRHTPAMTLKGRHVWIDAGSVWADAEHHAPSQPNPVGLTVGDTHEGAALKGLCQRLGHEAILAREHVKLPAAPVTSDGAVTLLDGRLRHDVPTVVAIVNGSMRAGAGSTWQAARGRALFGEAWPAADGELEIIAERLAAAGVAVVLADMGSTKLADLGIHRVSVQLIGCDKAGR